MCAGSDAPGSEWAVSHLPCGVDRLLGVGTAAHNRRDLPDRPHATAY
jgi:hypothetical protein|eukprot:COSAG01_NODE_4687_length_4810_cov_5.690772_4_plen_47_part_00